MTGKQVLITGATNGIGLAAADTLAALGENIVMVGRNETRTKIAAARVKATRRRGRVARARALPNRTDSPAN